MFGEQLLLNIIRLAASHGDIGLIGKDVAEKVILNLKAEAKSGPASTVSLRFCHRLDGTNERIYIDLAQDNGQCIEILPGSWRVLDAPPEDVFFRRSGASLQLPLPTRGGKLRSRNGTTNLAKLTSSQVASSAMPPNG